jgi:hypothetical protein
MLKPDRSLALLAMLAGCSARVVSTGADADVVADTPGVAMDVPLPPGDGPAPRPDLGAPLDVPPACSRLHAADLLFVIDDSGSMVANQANFSRALAGLFAALGSQGTSLHVGVVSTDLGTPGSTVPSCANSDIGDDGLLNPIRNGQAIRSHQPWTTLPSGARPSRCTTDPNQYPAFLTFDAATTDAAEFRDDVVCNAYLATYGCGLEQQLESAYRALVVHNPRERPGNMDPNAGFVRADAVLGILMLTDEEDGSVRDCRFAESGVACTDGIDVFDSTSSAWASTDLNLRFYMYSPGSAQDPTWSLDRYLDPSRPQRGFTSLKPGAPQLVVFGAIAGVPLQAPTTPSGGVDWNTLLGRNADGSDGYVGMSPEGPISMRQRNADPACSTRVVPACRREGSSYDPMRPACDTTVQYFAHPSRRVAQVVRRFDETYRNGVLGSICRNDYSEFMSAFARQVASRYCP